MDMNECKRGDKLLLRNGDIVEYIRCFNMDTNYTHLCNYEKNYCYSFYTNEGRWSVNKPSEKDVVGFANDNKKDFQTPPSLKPVYKTVNTNPNNNPPVRIIGESVDPLPPKFDMERKLGNQMSKPFNLQEAVQGKPFRHKDIAEDLTLVSFRLTAESTSGKTYALGDYLSKLQMSDTPPKTQPFNLEEAKQGKLYKSKSTNQIYSYVGTLKDGRIVSEDESGYVHTNDVECLQMIPDTKIL